MEQLLTTVTSHTQVVEQMKVLFLEAHPDDIALSCSGTLFKHKAEMDDIYFICMSDCNDLPRNKSLGKEVKKVMDCIGPTKEFRLRLKNRRLGTTSSRERIRGALERLRDKYDFDIVYSHWLGDIHQDHRAVAEETIRVFRHTRILMYENVHSTPHFNPNYYVTLRETEVRKKLSIIKMFKSQSKLYYAQPRIIRNRLESRGIEVKKDYAEAFIVWRLLA